MKQQLDRNLMQDALALSQAACYASMAAKEHREDSPQADAMLALTQKLTDMTIAALDAAVLPEIVAKPDEPTLADYVEQAKDAAAAGQPVPEIVQTVTVSPAEAPALADQPAFIMVTPPGDPADVAQQDSSVVLPVDATTAIADQSITLGDDAYKPLPVPMPAPVSLPSAPELAPANLDVASPVDPTPLP